MPATSAGTYEHVAKNNDDKISAPNSQNDTASASSIKLSDFFCQNTCGDVIIGNCCLGIKSMVTAVTEVFSDFRLNRFFTKHNFTEFQKKKFDFDVKKITENTHTPRTSKAAARKQTIAEHEKLPPIRLIPFEELVKMDEIPRRGIGKCEKYPAAPSSPDKTVTLNEINLSKAFIVFVSHCWLSGWNGLAKDGKVLDEVAHESWRQRNYPHPDNINNDKHKLIVEGINRLINWFIDSDETWLSDSEFKTYVWIDYGCMDQNVDPAGELKQLDKIVEISNCMFTPIVDSNREEWKFEDYTDLFKRYKASNFNVGPFSYLHRAWCRVEMVYAAHIPLLDVVNAAAFNDELKVAIENDFRAHFLYSTRDYNNSDRLPRQLPPLSKTQLEAYSPLKVIDNLTNKEDATKIVSLMEALKPFIRKLPFGYEGETNENGDPHGEGTYKYLSGITYEGEWEDGEKHGRGKQTWHDGSVWHDGEWKANTILVS